MTPSRTLPAACLLAGLFVPALTARAQTWDAGVKSGLSRSETPSDEFTWSGAPSTSFFLSRHLAGPFSIQPELAYVRRSGVSTVGASTLRLKADYIEVPVLIQAGIRTAAGITPFVAAGPSFSFRFRCRLQFTGGGLRTDEECNARGTPSNRVDVGVAGGGGIAWSIGVTTLSLEGRLNAGIRRNVLPTDVSDARAIGWSVLFGASVPTSRRGAPRPPVWMPPRMPLPLLPPAASIAPRVAGAPVARGAARVSITADNADARAVLLTIAELGGIDVVVSSEIQKRVTAHLIDVPADEAVLAIADVTGLSVVRPTAPGAATVVFLQAPVDVNRASAATVSSRFGVSGELAKFVTESQPARPPQK